MFYSIRHLTQFRYDAPVSESLMEVRMHPRTEGAQRCLSFQLSVDPRAQMNSYRDYLGKYRAPLRCAGDAYQAANRG
jgi:transglutaminase-like putative cysteine protease